MARVFLSYRRADGRYAVGWIAERLRQLDVVTDLRTAFQDSQLRCGDDFPGAIEEEVRGCDILVAVIGPNWLGPRSDGRARILDPADWVAREVSSALAQNKRILPVLIDGAEPLTRRDVPDHLAALTDLHAVPFAEASDLDGVVDCLRSHLEEIDRERARTKGLENEIEPARYRLGKLPAGAAVLAAVLGGFGGLMLATALPGNAAVTARFQQRDTAWVVAVVIELALWSSLAVVGHHYLWTHLVGRGLVRIRWRPVLITYAFILLLAAWVVAGFATSPPLAWGAARTWVLMVSFVVLLGPWILTALGVAWTSPSAHEFELGKRTRIISELDQVSWAAAAVVAAAGLTLVVAAAGYSRATTAIGIEGRTEVLVVVISWGLFLSGATIALFVWSRVQLRNSSTALLRDLKDITPQYRQNAEAHLVTEIFDWKRRWLIVWLLTPVGVAVSAIVWV